MPIPIFAVTMPTRRAEALAALIPMLGCGEEAATMAFDGLAEAFADTEAAAALRAIADEERVHDHLLRGLVTALPAAIDNPGRNRAIRRFHIDLGRGDAAGHLGRIAAVDAAVCTILSRLLRPGTPVADDPVVAGLFGRIRRDEANHVRVSRRLATAHGRRAALAEVGAAAREGLANLLGMCGDAFEDLAVDPAALDRDLRRLPRGLFAG